MMSTPDLKELSSELKQMLGLKWEPIAVKLITKEDHDTLPDESSRRLRYCQLLMEAKKGRSLLLTAKSISCPAAASALGFLPLPEKIVSGEMLKALGLFASNEAAAKTMREMPRLELGKYTAVAAAPLKTASFRPDVIVIEATPEQIMWINLASLHRSGGRLEFSSAVFQACCIDVTAIPCATKKVNVSLGCYGCRDSTDIADEECLIGIPLQLLPEIVDSLRELSKKAIPTARRKSIYANLTKQE
jgi:uncharacterized protein (DUF169 family)